MAAARRSIGRLAARLLGWALLAIAALTLWAHLALGSGKGGEAFAMMLVVLGVPSFLAGAVVLWLTRGRPTGGPPTD
ncbi:hypothetical protein [Azospirillum griseum]|uniref:Uncharacterized protein n=1 Tax=Azospirillum griseum TaxID=2496639 RepID=A0A3S0HUF8_9PROT|nr:hypothetical protein [Azospirillum griseum]RTR16048.1 hypothetical protein EJ903_21800 [Azospirillum griseum]